MKILFLCTGNACRSQIAEGWARALKGSAFTAVSAGTAPHGLDPRAVRVMAEAGVDISGHRAKHVSEVADGGFDHVITLCGRADEACPTIPGTFGRTHAGFDDPASLAQECDSEEEILSHYRRVRDEIRELIVGLPQSLGEVERS